MDEFSLKIYINELKLQIFYAEQSMKAPVESFLKYHHFLVHAAIICKILKPRYYKKKDSEILEQIKKDREQALKNYFNQYENINLNDLDVMLRNHLEHIDERIDKLISSGRSIIVDRNVVIGIPLKEAIFIEGSEDQLNYLRNMDNGYYTFYGEKYNIFKIQEVINQIKYYIENKD